MQTKRDERAEWATFNDIKDVMLTTGDESQDECPYTIYGVQRLLTDMDDAVRLLVAMYNNAPSADEFRLMVRTMGRTTEAAEDLMPQIDRLEKAEVEVVAFLKEPSES